MLQYILLDIDNTLLSFDEYVKRAMRDGFRKFGLPAYTPQMYAVFARHNALLWGTIERGEMTLPELEQVRWNRIFADLGIRFDGVLFEEYFKAALFDSAILIDGAIELLQSLHGKYTLCAASNGPLDQQIHRLTLAGMLPYFEAVFASEEIGFSKPAPEFFGECLRRLHACPQEAMIVGDSLSSDIRGGIRAGLHTCYYNPDGKPVPEDLPVEYNVRTLREIAALL